MNNEEAPSRKAVPHDSRIALGPDLPLEVFTSTEPWRPERLHAVALYCSDGRWGKAFDEFCHRHLQIPHYDRLAIPGGPAWLAARDDREEFGQSARDQLDFLVQIHELDRIVLVTHFGCAIYTERLKRPPEECLPEQFDDVRLAAAALASWYPRIRVEGYLAMRRERTLSFHELDLRGNNGKSNATTPI